MKIYARLPRKIKVCFIASGSGLIQQEFNKEQLHTIVKDKITQK